jgi:hypothetical protein
MSIYFPDNLSVEIPSGDLGKHQANLTWNTVELPGRTSNKIFIKVFARKYNDIPNPIVHTWEGSIITSHTFDNLESGTLYRFEVCYQFEEPSFERCTNWIGKTTNGPLVAPNPAPPIKEDKPIISSLVSLPARLKSKSNVEIRWNHRGSDGSIIGDIGELFDDFYWEWEIKNKVTSNQWSGLRRVDEARVNIPSLPPNTNTEFQVRLVKNPFLQRRIFSDFTNITFSTSPTLQSIRTFIDGESASNGLGKLFRQFGHDPKSVLLAIRS